MTTYLLKRILWFVPTLLAISFLAFGLSKCTPGDPVMQACFPEDTPFDEQVFELEYQRCAQSLGVDRPAFYFSLSSAAYPDTLHRIFQMARRETLAKLIAQYGNWPEIERYYQQLKTFKNALGIVPDSVAVFALTSIKADLRFLPFQYKDEAIQRSLDSIRFQVQNAPALDAFIGADFDKLQANYAAIKDNATPHKLYWPDFKWYGARNQYHYWFSHFLKGDFGVSLQDRRPVSKKIWEALQWTMLLNILAIFFAYTIAIPIGVYAAVNKGKRFDRWTSGMLFFLYSLPNFWVATLLIIFFTNSEYGMNWFPAFGTGNLPDDAPFWSRFWEVAYHLILPVFCLTYASLAFISRQMRGSMIEVFQQLYIRTAQAKGLSPRQVIWKHAFRNGLFPIITLIANIFPRILTGSVVIEWIFNIYGMGWLTIESIGQKDWPVVFSIMMLGAIVTLIGVLIADILYAFADPRVKYR